MVAHRAGFFYRSANEVWGKVMFLHLSVNLFTRWGGVCPIAYWDTHTPWADTPPPQAHTPLADTPPPGRQPSWADPPPLRILRDTVNKRAGMHTCLNFGNFNPRKVKKKFYTLPGGASVKSSFDEIDEMCHSLM